MSAAFNGDYTLTAPNDVRYSYVPFRGWQTVWTYKSTQEEIFTLADSYAASNTGATLDLSQDGPLWILVVSFDYKNDGVATEQPVNNWELLGNDIQKDIYEHPSMLDLGASVAAAIRIAVNKINTSSVENAATAYSEATGVVEEASDTPTAFGLFDLLVKGATHYSTSQFVLRRTQSVSNTYTTQFAMNDIEKIYTTAQIMAEAAIPGTIVFDISTITAPAARDDYQWGWLKRSPQVQIAAGGKIQVTQEYWLEQWSTILYDIKT